MQARITLSLVTFMLACNGEPYPIEPGYSSKELPDVHIDLEAERADPGDGFLIEDRERDIEVPCTKEELEAFHKEMTHNGVTQEMALVCTKPRPHPAATSATQPTVQQSAPTTQPATTASPE